MTFTTSRTDEFSLDMVRFSGQDSDQMNISNLQRISPYVFKAQVSRLEESESSSIANIYVTHENEENIIISNVLTLRKTEDRWIIIHNLTPNPTMLIEVKNSDDVSSGIVSSSLNTFDLAFNPSQPTSNFTLST